MQLATEELVTLGTGDLQNQFHCLLSCLQQFIDYLDNLEVTHLPDVVPHAPQPQQLYQSANDRLPAQTKHRVQISLCAVLAPPGNPDDPVYDERLSSIQWLHDPNWAQQCTKVGTIEMMPLPEGLQVPLETYYAMLEPTAVAPCADVQWEIYVDGATSWTAAAWSVVIVKVTDYQTVFHGQLSGNVELDRTSNLWVGADTLDNIAAEFQAFLVALLIVHSHQLQGRVVIRPDLQLSRAIATFDCCTHSNPIMANLIRHLAYWIGGRLQVIEVRGHRHQPWNELADRLAKFVLQQPASEQPFDFLHPLHSFAIEYLDTQWAWMQHCPTSLLHAFPPICDGQVMQFPLSLRRTGHLPDSPQAVHSDVAKQIGVSFCMATVNVLALETAADPREFGRRIGARTQRLDAQWHAQGIHILGLQEARTTPGVFHSEHYKIWSSGPEGPTAVRFGCELWCHRTLPLAHLPDGAPLTLDAFQVIVVHTDPRRLVVKFEHMDVKFVFVVLHTPCLHLAQGPGHRSLEDVQTWWQHTTELLHTSVHEDLVWFLIDANAPLASGPNELCGMHGADRMNQQGYLFEEFLQDHRLLVPCTFERFHRGPTTTWTHPSGTKLRRDYVLVSPAAASMVQESFVLTDHDTTFEHEDHLPVCLRVHGLLQQRACEPDRIRWDYARLQDPQLVAGFQAALATLPLPTWDVNVDEHCQLYETNLLQLARQFFEKTTKSRHRHQLSAPTLAAIAFKRHVLDCGRAWNLMMDPDYKACLKAIEKEVKAKVHTDLQIYYDQLLVALQDAGDLHNFKSVHRILARLGSKKVKRATPCQPLPALRKPDGTFAHSFTEQQMVWMQQFSTIEAGTQLHWKELQRLDRPGLGPPLDVQMQDLFPSPWRLQQLLRKLKRGKVPGSNRLPPEVLKAGAAPFCTQLCALTTKAVAHCKEPLVWKGGVLVPLSKGKPDAADPLGYRSIFISDFTAKLYHTSLRDKLVQVWERGLTSFQLGGRRRMGADLAHHVLQAHSHWATSHKRPFAHVFFDIRSAFYSVLRQALFPDDGPPLSLLAALHRFRVQSTDIDYMLSVVQFDNATDGIDDHFRLLLKDALTNTHFFIKGLDAPCRTNRGTRPGDPLGDLLYNMVMSLIMRDARQRTLDATDICWTGAPEPCASFFSNVVVPPEALLDLAFVDDCAVAIHAGSIARVQEIVQVSVHSMDIAAKGRGLLLNYAAGKTEVMLHLVGRGSTHAKLRIHDQGNKMVWRMSGVPYELRVVHCYKHLGTWLQQGSKMRKECVARGAAAKQAWGPYIALSIARSTSP